MKMMTMMVIMMDPAKNDDDDGETSGIPSPYSPSSILILVNRGEELSMLLLGSTWIGWWWITMTTMKIILIMISEKYDKKTLGESGRGRGGEEEWGGEEGRGMLL